MSFGLKTDCYEDLVTAFSINNVVSFLQATITIGDEIFNITDQVKFDKMREKLSFSNIKLSYNWLNLFNVIF